jgi:shikimate kinase
MEHQLSPSEIDALAARIDRPIVLVGMMGVGKTSVGKRLSALLHMPFIDADEEIERAAQMGIPEIFERFGEAYFRDGERRVIARLLDGPAETHRKVIATGGGAFVNEQTRALVLEQGLAVWLDSDVEVLLERVGRKDNRPRLKAERESAYAQAPIHVKSGHGPHGRTVAAILEAIDQWL